MVLWSCDKFSLVGMQLPEKYKENFEGPSSEVTTYTGTDNSRLWSCVYFVVNANNCLNHLACWSDISQLFLRLQNLWIESQ